MTELWDKFLALKKRCRSEWNWKSRAGGRERLYCFPLFAHDQLIITSVTSHSNGSKLRLACRWRVTAIQGGAEDSYSAWHFFCVRIIQQKVTSHPVRQRATSLPGAKAKIYGNMFFYSVSKMMIFCNRLHILSLFFVHPVKELSLFTSMDYSTV